MKPNKLTYELQQDGKALDGRTITVKVEHYDDVIKNMDNQDLHMRLIFIEKESNLRLGEFLLPSMPEEEAKKGLVDASGKDLNGYLECL